MKEILTKNDSQDKDARFAGVLGQDYNLRSLSMPHHEEFQDTIKNSLKEFAQQHRGESKLKVLEAGTGTGLTTFRILDADPRIKVITIDNEEKTINQAKKALEDLNERIEFKQGDILSSLKHIPDSSIDAFASALTVHNFPSEYREEVFREVARILKSKGLFINADKYAIDNEQEHKKSLQDQIDLFKVYDTIGRSDVKEAWAKHYIEDENTRITEAEQINLLKNLGFEDIKIIFREGMEAVIRAIKK